MSIQGTVTRVLPGPGAEYGQGTYAEGSSDDASLQASFPASPIYGGTVDDSYIVKTMMEVLDGEQSDNSDFGTIDMDYKAAPTLDNTAPVTWTNENGTTLSSGYKDNAGDGRGGPAGPFVPTTASPDGTTDPDDQPGVVPVKSHGGNLGSTASPASNTYSYDLNTAYEKGSSS